MQDLCEGMALRGHTIQVATPFLSGGVARAEVKNGVKIVRLPSIRLMSRINYIPSLIRTLREFRPDLIHLHGYGCMLMNDQVAIAFPNTPKVLTGHGGEILTPYPGYSKPILQIYGMLFGSWELKSMQRIVALTNFEREYLLRMGVPEEHVSVISPGLKLLGREISSGEFRRDWNLVGKHMVLLLGRIHQRKGQSLLLKSMPQIVSAFPDSVAVFVGSENDYAAQLRRFARLTGVEENILFTGHLGDNGKLQALAACDVYVSASSWESFGSSVVEAMLFGKPVVAADVGGMSELIEDGVSGLLFATRSQAKLAKQVCRLLASATLRRKLGEAGRERAMTHFTIDRMLDAYESLYRNLVLK